MSYNPGGVFGKQKNYMRIQILDEDEDNKYFKESGSWVRSDPCFDTTVVIQSDTVL